MVLAFFNNSLKTNKMGKSVNIIAVAVASAATTGTNTITLDSGVVKSVKFFSSSPTDNHNNTGMVRAEIKVNGRVIAPLQAIDNFRSKDLSFDLDGLPIEDIGGCQVEINVIATVAFASATEFDFVFNYQPNG